MNKKLKKLFNNPKAYFYDYFRKQVRAHPNGPVSLAVKMAFANAKTDLGYGNEIRKYLRQGKLEQAENICIEGIGVVPKAISPIVLFADVSMRKGDFAEALNRWQKVIEKFPHKADGYAGEARAYAALGDYEHVEQLCRDSIKNMPQELWPYIELAEISMRQGNFGEAIERWGVVRAKFPDKVQGYVRASVACCSLGRFAEAEELCRECMKVAPGDIRAYAEYAEVSLRQRDFNEGLKRCQTVRERFPGRADGYVRAAWAYSEIKEYPKAEDLCRKSMEIAPKDIRSFSEYAEISMRKGDFKEASNRWEIVRDKFPHRINGYIGGGRAYADLMDFKKSEELLYTAIQKQKLTQGDAQLLFFELISVILRDPEQAHKCKCIEIFKDFEKSVPKIRTVPKFYLLLSEVAFFMLTKEKIEIKDKRMRYVINTLLQQPLENGSDSLGIQSLINKLGADQKIRKEYFNKMDEIILESNLNNTLSNLLSTLTSDENRIHAFQDVIKNNWNYARFFDGMSHNKNMSALASACEQILKNNSWHDLDPEALYGFVRALNSINQDKADTLVHEISEKFKNKSFPLSNPIGVLVYRNNKRHERYKMLNANDSISSVQTNKQLSIAVCVSGQLRGYIGCLEALLQILGLEEHKYRVFVHTWNNVGRKFPIIANSSKRTFGGEFFITYLNVFSKKKDLVGYIKNIFPNFYSLLINTNQASIDDLREYYKTDDIVIEDEEDERFLLWSNQEKMHYKIYAAHSLAVNSGEKFDLEIRIRPDCKLSTKEKINLLDIYENSKSNLSVFTPGGLINSGNFKTTIINDWYAIGVPEAMSAYTDTYKEFKYFNSNKTFSYPNHFMGHVTIEHNIFINGVKIEKTFGGTLLDPYKLSIHEIYTALRKDIKTRIPTSEDQMLLDACKKDISAL